MLKCLIPNANNINNLQSRPSKMINSTINWQSQSIFGWDFSIFLVALVSYECYHEYFFGK